MSRDDSGAEGSSGSGGTLAKILQPGGRFLVNGATKGRRTEEAGPVFIISACETSLPDSRSGFRFIHRDQKAEEN